MENEEKNIEELYNDSLKYYCYLDDAIGIDTSKELKYTEENGEEKINGKCYKDPDGKSKELYEDILKIYNLRAEKMGLEICIKNICIDTYNNAYFKFNTNKVSNEYIKDCSTDYIGPSRATGKKLDISTNITGQILKIGRTIGGHIFWPCHKIDGKNTINCAKGCCIRANNITDRIDYTLAELRNFLSNKDDCKYRYSEGLFEAFKRYEEWFRIFGDRGNIESFKNFIDFMFLDDFVDKDTNYDIIELCSNQRFKEYSEDKNASKEKIYEYYATNLCNKILKRTQRIVDFAKENNLIIQDTKNQLKE